MKAPLIFHTMTCPNYAIADWSSLKLIIVTLHFIKIEGVLI